MTLWKNWLVPLFLLIPVIGLAAMWIMAEAESDEGTIWEVPIAGYDPRDLLRGHYVQFTYDWPGIEENERGFYPGALTSICINGSAPDIQAVTVLDGYSQEDRQRENDCTDLIKANPWAEEGANGLIQDRLFVPQERAKDYEKKLFDRKLQGFARIRVNNSGFIIPQDLVFRAREPEDTALGEGSDNGSE